MDLLHFNEIIITVLESSLPGQSQSLGSDSS
jgi:hypothetical protein